VFIEDFQGTTALDDPAFTDRLGYEGQVYEDRVGVYNLTIHTSGSMASVTHVEGDVTATYWTWARCPRHSIEAGGHDRDLGPDEFELLDLSDGHLDRATPRGPARPSGE
jgi:hypothetical protein